MDWVHVGIRVLGMEYQTKGSRKDLARLDGISHSSLSHDIWSLMVEDTAVLVMPRLTDAVSMRWRKG